MRFSNQATESFYSAIGDSRKQEWFKTIDELGNNPRAYLKAWVDASTFFPSNRYGVQETFTVAGNFYKAQIALVRTDEIINALLNEYERGNAYSVTGPV